MKYLILGIIYFVLVYGLYLVTIIFNKKKMKEFLKTKQAQFFIIKYKLNTNKINVKLFANIICLSNSFIITFALLATELVNNYFLKLIVGLIVLIPSILIIYHIIGINYKKKEGK